MENKEKISCFLDEINAFSEGKIRNIEGLKYLLNITDEKAKLNEFLDLIFFSKFVVKLHRILSQKSISPEEAEKIKPEFILHAEKVKDILKSIVSEDISTLKYFDEKYLTNTPESFSSFISLLNDLAWIKNWHIDNKKLW